MSWNGYPAPQTRMKKKKKNYYVGFPLTAMLQNLQDSFYHFVKTKAIIRNYINSVKMEF